MGQIKYLPRKKCKKSSIEELKHYADIQDWITGARNEMNNRIKDMPKYWQVIERSLFHQKFKDRIKLVNEND